MARDTKVRLYRPSTERDALGEITGKPVLWREVWATLTQSGGRTNTYAGRIVRENEAIFSTPWLPGIDKACIAEWEGYRRPITAIVPEGFRKTVHIKVTINDIDYDAGY